MKYIGLDIHKKDTQASVLDEKGKFVHGERIRTDVKDIGHFFEKALLQNYSDRHMPVTAS